MTEGQTKLVICENIELAPLTTFKVGGPARFFVETTNEADILEAVAFAQAGKLPLFVLGGGSNLLVADTGFNGLVLRIALTGIETNGELVTAAAGEDWDSFVEYCVGNDFQGIECLSGIPGLVGGTPVQNVGAYGQEVSETIEAVRVFDRKDQKIRVFSNADCRFSYRTSIFNSTDKDRYIVLAVTFRLNPGGAPKIVYKDLIAHFGDRIPNLREMRDAVRKIRAEKAMLVRQGGPDSQSAGSFFKNPIVGTSKLNELSALLGSAVPNFAVDNDRVKIPAAWLIEKAGFQKGYTKGKAGLSTKHTLAVTNRGGATARDILNLKAEIEDQVRVKFGIDLQPEPVFIGFE